MRVDWPAVRSTTRDLALPLYPSTAWPSLVLSPHRDTGQMSRPRPSDRRAAQAQRRRPRARRGAAARHRRGADAGLDGRRGAAPHADHRPGDLLEPLPTGVLGQGRHLRTRAVGQGGAPRLRRRHRCWSRSTRRARRATPAPAPASTTGCSRWLSRAPGPAAAVRRAVIGGLAAGSLAAVAGNQAWVADRRRAAPGDGAFATSLPAPRRRHRAAGHRHSRSCCSPPGACPGDPRTLPAGRRLARPGRRGRPCSGSPWRLGRCARRGARRPAHPRRQPRPYAVGLPRRWPAWSPWRPSLLAVRGVRRLARDGPPLRRARRRGRPPRPARTRTAGGAEQPRPVEGPRRGS